MPHYLLAIDQGTTSSRAIVFTTAGKAVSQHQIDLTQSFPNDGWVEQDPEELWRNTLECCRVALKKINLSAKQVAGIGISNQRETTIIWDRKTGHPIYPAIVWQDRRTSELCAQLKTHSIAESIQEKTGLLLDPYFSATKIMWLFEHIPGAREKAEQGELAFGTIDTFLLWRLTNGKVHATDATNASRTLLFNIKTQQWDKELLKTFDIPDSILPNVMDCSANFGETAKEHFGVPILVAGMAGDQQAATVGQACFHSGMVKSTYGTGCFVLLNTGDQMIHSKNKLLSTVAYRFENKVTYGLEGSIFCAGVTIKWLRDTLKLIKTAAETESLAAGVADTGGVYFVPAFTGLGAPFWDPNARGMLSGLTRNTRVEHIVRAALEAVGYQTRDLMDAIKQDALGEIQTLRVDGGMAANNWLLQFIADMVGCEVEKPACIETSALGAAFLAGLQVGVYHSLDDISAHWESSAQFHSSMLQDTRKKLYDGWQQAIARVIGTVRMS